MIAGASWPGGPIGPAGPISPRWPSRPGTPRAPSAQTLRNDGGKAFVAPIGRYLRLLLNRGVAQLADEASAAIVPVFHDEIAVQTAREVPIFPLEPLLENPEDRIRIFFLVSREPNCAACGRRDGRRSPIVRWGRDNAGAAQRRREGR